jgi:hypothetical protein
MKDDAKVAGAAKEAGGGVNGDGIDVAVDPDSAADAEQVAGDEGKKPRRFEKRIVEER